LGMKTKTTLSSLTGFPGFRASNRLKGILGDPQARIITLTRRQKKRSAAPAAQPGRGATTPKSTGCGTCLRLGPESTWNSNTGGLIAASAKP
jgi:hypothetical protein